MFSFHSPLVLIAVLVCLAAQLVYLRVRFGSILVPLKERLGFRLLMAAIAGCLAAWLYLPEGFFPGPQNTLGLFLPGTAFGLLVLIPLLDNPAQNWIRSAILLWIATVGHAAVWVTGLYTLLLLEDAHFPAWDWLDSNGYNDLQLMLLGIPALVVFGLFIAIGVPRVLRLRLSRSAWISILAVSSACGILYADAVTSGFLRQLVFNTWPALDDLPVYVAYVVWYTATAAVLARRKLNSATLSTRVDVALLAGLAFLTFFIIQFLFSV